MHWCIRLLKLYTVCISLNLICFNVARNHAANCWCLVSPLYTGEYIVLESISNSLWIHASRTIGSDGRALGILSQEQCVMNTRVKSCLICSICCSIMGNVKSCRCLNTNSDYYEANILSKYMRKCYVIKKLFSFRVCLQIFLKACVYLQVHFCGYSASYFTFSGGNDRRPRATSKWICLDHWLE